MVRRVYYDGKWFKDTSMKIDLEYYRNKLNQKEYLDESIDKLGTMIANISQDVKSKSNKRRGKI